MQTSEFGVQVARGVQAIGHPLADRFLGLIETPRGWLMLYHGVRRTAAGCLYRLGVALASGSVRAILAWLDDQGSPEPEARSR